MFSKFIAKRFINALLSEASKKLPELSEKIKEEVLLRKDAFLEDIKEHLKTALIDFLKKHFGK